MRSSARRGLLRVVLVSTLGECILLLLFLLRARSAGAHDLSIYLLALTQLPGLKLMAAIFPDEASGGPAWVALYYVGVGLIQVALAVLVVAAARRIGRAGRN
jgi:hypothetical protein